MANFDTLTETFSLGLSDQLITRKQGELTDKKVAASTVKAALADDAATVKAKYESNPDTNAFTDAEKTKLATTNILTTESSDGLTELLGGGETSLHGHAAADISVDETNLNVATGATVQAYLESNNNALLKGRNTGILNGGNLTSLGGGVIRIAAGSGQILDITNLPTFGYFDLTWAQTNLNLSAIDGNHYIYVNSLGQVSSTTSRPDHAEYRDFVWLHRVLFRNGLYVNHGPIPAPTIHINASMQDLWKAIGLVKEGLRLTPNGANLSINVAAGNIYTPGASFYANPKSPNEIEFNQRSPLVFFCTLQDGTRVSLSSVLDVGFYDLNGVRTAVPNPASTTTVFQLMQLPSEGVECFYGQTLFSSVSDALAAVRDGSYRAIVPTDYAEDAITLGWVIAEKGATALNDGVQAFATSNRFGEYGGGITASDAGSLLASNNLNDLADLAAARTNLSVYSVSEIDTAINTVNTTVAANTAKLATIASGAEVNVNADWNAVSGDAQILNKPTIPTSTTNLPEGTNLYYTEARVTANSTVSANTAKLATIATGAEVNVNADWNAVSGDAQILNKPTIPTTTTQITEGTRLYYTEARVTANSTVSANTTKLATIATGAEVNVQSNWNEADSASDAFILNKPTIPTTTTQITEGTRLYYTEARVTANTTVAANTAKLATIATGAEVNVNADWNAVSGDAQILNKPTIPTTTTQIAEGTNLYFTNARSDSSDSGQYAIAQTCELYVGAAATATGVDPERTADLEDVGFVGIAPYNGNKVALYDPIDQRWYLRTVSAVGLNLSGLAANTNFDLYLGWVGGALSFTTSDWLTSGAGTSTRRTTFDEFIDGIPTRAGNPFYRFIGTFRTASTGTTSDSAQNRLVSNVAHKRWKPFSISNDPLDYTYVSTTVREFGNGSTQRINIAASEPTAIIVNSTLFCGSSGSLPVNGGTGGIGVNSTTARSGQSSAAVNQLSGQRVLSSHSGIIPAGYNYLAMLEQGFDGNGTTTDDIQMRQSTLNGAVYL